MSSSRWIWLSSAARRRLATVGALALLLAVTGVPSAQTNGAPATTIELPVALTIPGRTIVLSVPVQVDAAFALLSISAEPVLNAIRPVVAPEVFQAIQREARDGRLTPDELDRVGLALVLDPLTLEIALTVPTRFAAIETLVVASRPPEPAFDRIAMSRFSFALPVWTAYRLFAVPETEAAHTLQIDASPTVTVGDWVASGLASLVWDSDGFSPTITGTTVSHTWFGSSLRMQVGQVAPTIQRFQPAVALYGVSVDNLANDGTVAATDLLFRDPIIAESSGSIDVRVNGDIVRSLPVAPGRYLLERVPLAVGVNAIDTRFTPDSGDAVTAVRRIIPNTTGLLRPGHVAYAAVAGVEESDLRRPGLSGFVRYGAGRYVSVGASVDAFVDGALVGSEVVAASRVGEFAGGTWASWDYGDAWGAAARASYRLGVLDRRFVPVFGVAATLRSRGFVPPLASLASDPPLLDVATSLSQTISRTIGATAAHVLSVTHDGGVSVSRLYGTLSIRLFRGLSVRVAGYVDTNDPRDGWGASIVAGLQSNRAVTAVTTTDVRERTADLSIAGRHTGRTAVTGALEAGGIGLTDGTVRTVRLASRASGGLLDGSGRVGITLSEGEAVGDQTLDALSAEGQIGFGVYTTGTNVAVARPIEGPWIIVRRDDALPVARVDATLGTGGSAPRSTGWWGPAVVGPLEVGRSASVLVAVPGLPADVSLTGTEVSLLPRRVGGAVVSVQAINRLYIRGDLRDGDGEPITLVGLAVTPSAVPMSADGAARGTFAFTGPDGVFEIYDVEPGQYDVALLDGSGRRFTIDVPIIPGPRYDAGTFTADLPSARQSEDETE